MKKLFKIEVELVLAVLLINCAQMFIKEYTLGINMVFFILLKGTNNLVLGLHRCSLFIR